MGERYGGAVKGDAMLFGRDAIQVVTTAVYVITLGVIAVKLYYHRRSILVFVPLIVNVAFTVAFYFALFFLDISPVRFGDLSAILRLETGFTILLYAVYMPPLSRLR